MKAIVTLLFLMFSIAVSAQCAKADSAIHRRCIKSFDSLDRVNDTLRTKLFLSEYKIEKVRFYLGITDRKPSQVKYLRGWIRRSIE